MVTQQQLDMARADDERMNRDIAGRAGKNGLQAVVDQDALMHAVATEGREILTREGRGYWNDMKRRYPHLRGGREFIPVSANGRRSRFGTATLRKRGKGPWERWDAATGTWIAERESFNAEAQRRRGAEEEA